MHLIERPNHGDALDASKGAHPSKLKLFAGSNSITGGAATSYGYVLSGRARVETEGLSFIGVEGTFFCIPGEFELEADGLVAVIHRYNYWGLMTAGRIEEAGRLPYLNGCSSTVLVSPPKSGDPVLNLLHIPQGIDQTHHTHPSIRMGIVIRGEGLARGYDKFGLSEWEKPLTTGCLFLLEAGEVHAFSTVGSPRGIDLVTYHPDSDWGPTDDNHPMLTATIFENESTR